MSIKPKYKHRLIWFLVSIIGLLSLYIIVLPPIIHLNSLKPKIQDAIFAQTGIRATIHGDINFSLLGKTTIIAHNITIPDGFISSFEFSIPWSDMFNIQNAKISDNITINGASLVINKITPFNMNNDITVKNSKFNFLNKEYEIINGHFSKNVVSAVVRTDQHKYDITSIDNNFTIKNKNNNLNLYGKLLSDGTATAHISIVAQDVNRWFEFKNPRITGTFPITANMKWDGGYGIDFSDISANGVFGSAELAPNGYKNIKLVSKNANYDMSFAIKHPEIFKNAHFDMDFYGKIKFADNTFKHLYINVIGHDKNLDIQKIIADNFTFQGGNIDETGAHNINISLYEKDVPIKCLFNGTPTNWSCDTFSYGNLISGNINLNKNHLIANISAQKNISDIDSIIKSAYKLSDTGTIKFNFPNMAGTIRFTKKTYSVQYDFAKNKSLKWANIKFDFIPDSMQNEQGDIIWQNDTMLFTPASKTWSFGTNKNTFYITGTNFKQWLPNLDLQSIRDLPYTISGNYNKGNISNLNIEIAGQKFIGSASGKSITLKTDLLNIDSFISQEFLDNFEALSFFTVAPITIPFDIGVKVSLSADSLVYNEHKYNDFVYSLKTNTQTFSITDSNRGNMLTTIKKQNNNYTVNIQLNKFVIDEKLLPNNMPLNISNSAITAEIKLKTFGKIAHDIFENINGTFDLYFDGGILYGLGLADFYASAANISILNAEFVLAKALESGITPIKNMRIIGTYNSGDIETTKPLSLALKHTDAFGTIQIKNKEMTADLKLILRGTSPASAPIDLTIYPNNKRKYSLSEIMLSFDPEYMRSFTQSHNKF